MKIPRSIYLALLAATVLLCALPPVLRADDAPAVSTLGDSAIIYLGSVQLRGEVKITQTLQAIKLALQMPYSADPKFANVVICRLEDKPGSSLYKILICGSNHNLAGQRLALQAAFDSMNGHDADGDGEYAGIACAPGCFGQVFGTLNETLDSMPEHYLKTTVDGAALSDLLRQVPYPRARQPASI